MDIVKVIVNMYPGDHAKLMAQVDAAQEVEGIRVKKAEMVRRLVRDGYERMQRRAKR